MNNGQVIKFSRSWRSLVWHYFIFLFSLVVGLYVTAYYPGSILVIPLDSISESNQVIRLPVFLLISLFLVARPLVLLFDSHYELTDHHLRVVRGKMSIFRRAQEFAFEDLLGVQVTQSILSRLLNVGVIEVGSKTSQIQIRMRGIGDPHMHAKEISNRIDLSRISEKTAL